MKGFVKELISRLEEYKSKAYVSGMTSNSYEFGACRAMDSAIDIVKQLAEEYKQDLDKNKQGWIPCSERLPEVFGEYIVMIEGAMLPTCLTYNKHSNNWYAVECEEVNYYTVIAWMPLPEPYKPSLVQDSPSLVQDWKDSMMNKFDGKEV